MKKMQRIIVMLLVFSLIFNNINVIYTRAEEKVCGTDENIGENIYYDVVFNIESEWDNHYNGKITIKNASDSDIENWEISFVSGDTIENIWCGQVKSHEADTYVIKNVGWNQDVKAGEEVSFGFTASYTSEKDCPHSFNMMQECKKVEMDKYSIDYKIQSEWENGLIGEITISNESNEEIEDWKLVLDTNVKINNFWTADICNVDKDRYYIGNKGYNANIKAKQKMTLGFYAVKEGKEVLRIDNAELYSMQTYKPDTTDTDGDGVYNVVEEAIGTDPNSVDSDGDKLNDYQEIEILGLDPTNIDTDGNQVPDADEDNDEDGLTNEEEIAILSNPMDGDSDDDRLTDFEEEKKYGTNCNIEDTDGDGVCDFIEIQLGLNPLIVDTDNNGVCDAEEKISQTYTVNFEDELITTLSVDMSTSKYLEDELFVECENNTEELLEKNMQGTILTLDGDFEEDVAAHIKVGVNEQNYSEEVKVYLLRDNQFTPYHYVYDEVEKSISVDMSNINDKICFVYENAIATYAASSKKKYTKNDLIKDIKSNFEKEKGWKTNIRTYSVSEAIDIVLKYDSEISAAAKKYKVKKAVIQSILTRELICIWAQDGVVDSMVQNYYYNKGELQRYMSMKWWQQLFYGSPKLLYPEREDSSTGIGQMYAETSIKATNYLKETNIKYSDWKKRKSVWYSLKDKNEYSAEMGAKVLCYNAGGKDMSKPTKKEIKNMSALYNASTVKKGASYGKKIYKYNRLYVKYNKWN